MNGRKQPIFDVGLANVWFCDRCKMHGPADIDPNETVQGAIEKLREAHRLTSPDCLASTAYIRIVNLESVKAQWRVA